MYSEARQWTEGNRLNVADRLSAALNSYCLNGVDICTLESCVVLFDKMSAIYRMMMMRIVLFVLFCRPALTTATAGDVVKINLVVLLATCVLSDQ